MTKPEIEFSAENMWVVFILGLLFGAMAMWTAATYHPEILGHVIHEVSGK